MAKIFLLFATISLLLLIANASFYRTSIEIENLDDEFDLDILDDENPHQQAGKHCQKEFVAHKRLKACQRFIRRQAQSPRDADEENSGQLFQNCCQQLKRIDVPCRCPSLKMALKQQLQPSIELELPGQQSQESQESQEGKHWKVKKMIETASELPSMCKIPPQSCPFKQPRWWFDE